MHYESMYPHSRRNSFGSSSRTTVTSAESFGPYYGSSGSSKIAGLKSYLSTKQPSYSLPSDTSNFPSTHISPTFSFTSDTYAYLPYSPGAQYPLYKPVVPKTCDSFPMISPQLHERLLQLADRSRRLGAHRYSRSRNALVLNRPPPARRSPAVVAANRFYPTLNPIIKQIAPIDHYRPYRE
jgi:hypothetical protein